MRKVWILTAVFFCFIANGFTQEIKDIEVIMNPALMGHNELPYSERPLSWNDFKGKPEKDCAFIAMTYSGFRISHRYRLNKDVAVARIEIHPYMDLSRSWYRKELCNENTLAHEQRHFDITAIVTRMFAAELKKRKFTTNRFLQDVSALYEEYMGIVEKMQEQYDKETHHGTMPERQAYWDKKIGDQLRESWLEG